MDRSDDHELLLWAMRAGLTCDEVRQAVRRDLDAGRIPWQRADETQAQRQERINLDMEAIWVVGGVGDFIIGAVGVADSVGRGVSDV